MAGGAFLFLLARYRSPFAKGNARPRRRRANGESRSELYQHHEVGHPMFPPASQPAHAPVVKPGSQLHWRAKAQEFRFHLHVVPRRLFYEGGCQEKKLLLRVGPSEIRVASSPTLDSFTKSL